MSQKAIANARNLEDRARELQRQGKFHDAEEPLLLAMSIWKLVAGPDNIEIINDEIALAASYRRRGDVRLAIEKLDHATGVGANHFADDAEWAHVYRLALNNLGIALHVAGDFDKARASLELALSLIGLAAEAPEDLMVEKARVLDNLSNTLRQLHDETLAEARNRESVELWTELRGLHHLDTVIAMSNLGAIQMSLGKLDDARTNLVDCGTRLEALLGAGHPTLADHWLVRAELALREGAGSELAQALERCLTIARAAGLAEHHPTVTGAKDLLAATASRSPN